MGPPDYLKNVRRRLRRRLRRRQTAPVQRPASSGPSVVVLTMARDEGPMLDRWVRHYGAQVGVQHLVVLDDNSSDGSTDDLPCTVHRLPQLAGGREFESSRMRLVSGIADGFLAVYDYVIFVDADEFLVADPAQYANLRDFLRARPDADVIAGMALNVVHALDIEGDLDPALPILGQRRYAKFIPLMCKPSIKRIPAPWGAASHGIGVRFAVDPELFMIHLKFYDRQSLKAKAEDRRSWFDEDGRGAASNWQIRAPAMMRELRSFIGDTDLEDVAEFDPGGVDLSSIVRHYKIGLYRTPAHVGQIEAMRKEPLVRVPERLIGML